MTSLLEKKNDEGIQRGSIIGGLCVGAVVLSFFFLPEILNLQFEGDEASEPTEVALSATPSPTATLDPGELLNTPLNKDDQDEAPATSSESEAAPDGTPITSVEQVKEYLNIRNPSPSEEAPYDGEVVQVAQKQARRQSETAPNCQIPGEQERGERPLLPTDGPITWRDLAYPDVQEIIKNAAHDTRTLIRNLDRRHTASRFQLVTFLQALQTLQFAKEDGAQPKGTVLDAEQALEYALHSDLQVTDTLVRDGVDRSVRLDWEEISLAPLIGENFASRKKQKAVQPFRPKLYLTNFFVRHEWFHDKKRIHEMDLKAQVKGFVAGDTADRYEYAVVDGPSPRFRKLYLDKPDQFGKRAFNLRNLNNVKGKGLIIRLTSRDKQVVEYRYAFRPKYGWEYVRDFDTYAYRTPVPQGDPRLTKAFLMRTVRYEERNGRLVDTSKRYSNIVEF
ncbi:hypothetical protein MRY87_11315 [bacterium]|nr:hypothetical protein [bacterium]